MLVDEENKEEKKDNNDDENEHQYNHENENDNEEENQGIKDIFIFYNIFSFMSAILCIWIWVYIIFSIF